MLVLEAMITRIGAQGRGAWEVERVLAQGRIRSPEDRDTFSPSLLSFLPSWPDRLALRLTRGLAAPA